MNSDSFQLYFNMKVFQCIQILIILYFITFWNLEVNNHSGYDYAEFTNHDEKSNPKELLKDNVEKTLATVQNPYYGDEVDIKESEASIGDKVQRNSLKENIKVTHNPYYEWFW